MTDLIIFDFDGTIFDTEEAIEYSMKQTFASLLPAYTLSQSELHRLISAGANLADTFSALHPEFADFNKEVWVKTYRALYATHGQSRSKPYPHVEEVLRTLRERKIPIAIISNKDVNAVKLALKSAGLSDYFYDSLVIGDNVPGFKRKPHTASYTDVLIPRLKEIYPKLQLRTDRVLMVGDTVADMHFGRNIESRLCYCRYGQGDDAQCEQLKPDFFIDSLAEFFDALDK